MIISGNYTLKVNPDWKQVQLDEIYLECDTSTDPVNIQLFEIAELLGFPNIKIYVSDISGNASTNNITITAGGSDFIDSNNSVVIDTDKGIESMGIVNSNQWIAVSSESGGPVGPVEVLYADTFFVDKFNGGRSGIQGNFTAPWFSIQGAINDALLTNPTTTERALVWIRKGEYPNQRIDLADNVDVYCEPGVVFTGICLINDFTGALNVRWTGSAIWNCTYTTLVFQFNYASTVLIEGDTFYNIGGCGGSLNNDEDKSNVTYSFNSIESATGNGTGFMFTWRGPANGTVNAKEYIKCGHEHHDVRSGHTGNVVVNSPRNIATSNNQYGGNFSQIINGSGSGQDSFITINGDIDMTEAGHRGGIQSVVVLFGGCGTIVTINGNIISGDMPGLWNSGGGVKPTIIVNGSISGNRVLGRMNTPGGVVKFLNGSANIPELLSETTDSDCFQVQNNGTLILQNITTYNGVNNANIIESNTQDGNIHLFQVSAEAQGTGLLVNATQPATAVQIVGAFSNVALHPNCIETIANGLVVNANLKTN